MLQGRPIDDDGTDKEHVSDVELGIGAALIILVVLVTTIVVPLLS